MCFPSVKKVGGKRAGENGGWRDTAKEGCDLTVEDLTHVHQLEVENTAAIYPEHKQHDINTNG